MNRVVNSLMRSIGLGGAGTPQGVCIIAHSARPQALMDNMGIEWGVQYEIARGVSRGWWTWDDVTEARLKELRGQNEEAARKVPQVLPHSPTVGISQPDSQVWAELDREEAAIIEGRQRGLGLQGPWKDTEDWYGGKIQQVARIEEANGALRLVLAPMEMRKSCRFARFLGSRRLLQVTVPREIQNKHGDKLKEFFLQKFVLCGRVFVAFGMKDGKIFLMETREDHERGARVMGDAQRMSLEEFVDWHNPLDRNGKQAVSKWTTRFDLGLSISVPALEFSPDNIYNLDDEYAVDKAVKKTEHIYTDGCGFMNGAALSEIGRRMGYRTRPTAVQGRIAGAKGLWVLHPRQQSPTGTPKIWIRESQTKINLDLNNLHRAHCIFDLLAPPRVTLPSRLSRLTILNLSHNGVPTQTFVDLMRETLDEQVRALTRWSHPQDMQLLWATVNRLGHVTASRVQQYALGASRALGLSGRIREDEFPTDDPPDLLRELFDAAGGRELDPEESEALLAELQSVDAAPQRLRDRYTGEPLTIHGVVMDLLQAGFHPLRLPILYEKLKRITTKVIEDVIHDFHVSIPLSAEAFIVPDPYGVLEPGQIHFKSSEDLKPPLEDLNPNILTGEVLIYRNPNRLPSDVQKVTAVRHEKLADYTDVIVLPVKGPCSFASMLAGGDVCVCIYDPRLVADFRNSPLAVQPPNFLKDNFEDQGTIEQVAAVAAKMLEMANDPDGRRKKLQNALLSDLSRPLVGAYSMFHENAAYVHGYDALETIRNAFMFNTVLDARKSGLKVKDEVYRQDKRKYDRQRPACLSTRSAGAEGDLPSTVLPLTRPANLGTFILDKLLEEGKRMRNEHLSLYDSFTRSHGYQERPDQELLRLYNQTLLFAQNPAVKEHITLIREHVDKHIKRWREAASSSSTTSRTPARTPRARRRTAAPTAVESRNKWKELAQSFATGPDLPSDSLLASLGDLDAVKASWAYAQHPRFAWSVAFQTLCRIKAMNQSAVVMTGSFADAMSISSSAVRVFEQSRLGMS
ncbi:RNA dependent RNA polymerase-domain-containing protein [Trametes polyzona]|nr:RNA dependent RNA polymerase-domain-containing protein [Trametes polyzona]